LGIHITLTMDSLLRGNDGVSDTVPPCYSCAEAVSKRRGEAECFDSAPVFADGRGNTQRVGATFLFAQKGIFFTTEVTEERSVFRMSC
jgi:hypothetical protein